VKCGQCGAVLTQNRTEGGVMLRNHGLVIKSTGVAFVCPKCKADVTPTKADRDMLVLFLSKS